ncbi:unnamed protein product [Calypogeia fissa]
MDSFKHLRKRLFGTEEALREIRGLLRNRVQGLGIVGTGGIGKTTLAMELFDELKGEFDCHCFIRDVKDIKGLVEDVVLENMHYTNRRPEETGLRSLSDQKLLLVLDDVVLEKDLAIVSVLIDHVHRDSRFIVTSRDLELLKLWQIYWVSRLGPRHSSELLQFYAFPRDKCPNGVPRGYDALVKKVEQACNGLPLTLEVMGKYLSYNKPKLIWEQALQALMRGTEVVGFHKSLWASLKLSYDGLNKVEQGVFLDAATVFYEKDLEEAKAVWSITTGGFQDMIWQRLLDLCLVMELSYKDKSEFSRKNGELPDLEWDEIWHRRTIIGMQEQHRTLGKKIALTRGEMGRRMWETSEGKNDAASELTLYSSDDVKDIVSLKVDISDYKMQDDGENYSNQDSKSNKKPAWSSKMTEYEADVVQRSLCKMENLRYLHLSTMSGDSNFMGTLSSTLVFLHLRYASCVALDLKARNHRNLVVLKLEACQKLKCLPDSLGSLKELKHLEIIRCTVLTELPKILGQHLTKLERVVLNDCTNLSVLHREFCHIPSLKMLKIEDCANLGNLPANIGNLVTLEILVLKSCSSLKSLPEEIGKLPELRILHIEDCDRLRELPRTFLRLPKLEQIALKQISLLTVPDLTDLRSLENFQIFWKTQPETVPLWLSQLVIEADYCKEQAWNRNHSRQWERVENLLS